MLMLHSYVVLSGKKVRRMLFTGKATFSQACLEFKSTLPAGITRMSRLPLHALQGFVRSEEHTSELQTLMRISYALFSLIKIKRHEPVNTQRNSLNKNQPTH